MKNKSFRSISWLLAALAVVLLLASCITPPKVVVTPEMEKARAAAWTSLWGDFFSDAESGFRTWLKIDPQSAEAERGLGLALFAQGDLFQAGDHLLSSIEKSPQDPVSVAVRSFLAGYVPYRESMAARIQAVDARMADPRNPPGVRREGLRRQLWYALEIERSAEQARRLAALGGAVTGWKLLGPFPSISGAGFDTRFVDEGAIRTAVQQDPGARGVDNLPVKWITPAAEEPDARILVGQRFSGDGGCAYYGAASFSVAEEGDYWLVVGRVGALRIWIDGAVALSDPTDIAGDEMSWVRVHLAKGRHDAAVKVADERSQAEFRLSVVRAVGGAAGTAAGAAAGAAADPAADSAAETAARQALAALPGLPQAEADPVLGALAQQAAGSGLVEDRFWLAFLLTDRGYARAALAQSADIRKQARDAAFSFGRLVESRAYALLGRMDDSRSALRGPRTANPAFAPTRDYLVAEALEAGDYKEVERLLGGRESFTGTRFRSDVARVLLAADQGADMQARVADLRRAYPDVPAVDELLLSGSVRGLSQISIYAQLLQKRLPASIQLSLARHLLQTDYYEVAYKQAEQAIPLFPTRPRLRADALRAAWYGGARTYTQISEELDGLLAQFPRSWPVLDTGADVTGSWVSYLEEAAGTRSGTAAADELSRERTRLERYVSGLLELDPGDFAARERLRRLQGHATISSLVRLSDPHDIIAAYEKAEPAPTGDVVKVLNENVLAFFEDGGRRSWHQLVLRIVSKNGVREESSQELAVDTEKDDYRVNQAFVLKPNGNRTSAKAEGKRLSFPGLEPGDYIVLSYTVSSSVSGSLRRMFWTSAALDSLYPVYKGILRIIYPESMEPAIAYHNADGLPYNETRTDPFPGYKSVQITVNRAPAAATNAGLSDWRDALAWADVSSIPDWSPVVEWYRGLSAGRVVPSPAVDQAARRLTEDAAAAGVPAISSLYDFVSNKVDYEDISFQYSAFVPQTPESVLDDRYGDCKDKCALLLAMLKSAGVEAWIALSDPGYAGENTFLPSNRFSHTLVIVPRTGPGGTDLILDPTSGYLTYPDLPPQLAGTWYLPIPPAGSAPAAGKPGLRRIPAAEQPTTDIVLELAAGKDAWTVSGTMELRGVHAAEIRDVMQSADSEIQKTAFSLYAASAIPGVKLTEYSVTNVDNVLASPTAAFSGSAPTPVAGGSVLRLPWFQAVPGRLLDLCRSASLSAPVDIDIGELQTPWHQTCIVTLPAGVRVEALPENGELHFGAARAVFRYAMKDGRLVCERELYLPRMSVAPSSLPQLEDFLSAVAARQRDMVRLAAPVRK